MRVVFIFIFFTTFHLIGKCQNSDVFSQLQSKSGVGEVTIRQDSSIKHLVNKYVDYCQTAKGFPGYRIRIFSNSGNAAREQAKHAKNKFEMSYADVDSYLVYNNPNFEIFVGNFKTKSESLKLLKSLSSEYPSAFIVKTLITYNK